MFCIYGFPAQGQLHRIDLPATLRKGTVVREETLFYRPVTQAMQGEICNFLKRNLYVIANGDMLMYSAVDTERLIVEVELQHDQVYTAEPRQHGYLTVYVVQ